MNTHTFSGIRTGDTRNKAAANFLDCMASGIGVIVFSCTLFSSHMQTTEFCLYVKYKGEEGTKVGGD
jgi:hypothetical protein